ncbi:MAG: transcription-repair coupling factor [Fimbriimonadaceae bacterium]
MARRLVEIGPLRETLGELEGRQTWESVAVEARPLLIASAWHAARGGGSRVGDQEDAQERVPPFKALVVANNYDRALQWQARLRLAGVPEDQIKLLPSGLSVLFEDASPETVALSDRIGALKFLIGEEPGFVIATPQAALERTLPPEDLRAAFVAVRPGEETDQDHLIAKLQRLGYEHNEPVRLPGTFSRRGGIVDVFPMGFERPVRIEFFGDEVESLRWFDPNTQRSVSVLASLEIAPSRETMLPLDGHEFREMLERTVLIESSRLSSEAAARLESLVSADSRALEQRVFFDRLDLYRPLIHPESSCAIDLLGEEGLLVLDEPLELEATVARAEEEFGQALAARAKRGEILSATTNDYVLPPEHFGLFSNTLSLTAMNGLPSWLERGEVTEIGAESLAGYRGHATALTKAIQGWIADGLSVVVATDQPSRATAVLSQVDIRPTDQEDVMAPGLHLVEGNPAGGFVLSQGPATGAPHPQPLSPGGERGVVLLTDHELFGVARLKLPQRKFREGVPISNVLDLKPGDFIVHINFGIGVYRGLVKRKVDGVEKEFLFIEYKAPDKLYVPADQLDRVQKYLAPEEAPPKINRLTGGDWRKAVARAREEAREFARELIKLYAARKAVVRPGFGPDSVWQSEMEHGFPWVETPSQLEAIEDVKRDLRSDNPMDRLVCGDVGFGKTEVAIRAAFKVVQAGKQVAMLCPTTILSEQHARSFAERLAPFPTKIAVLNRFVHAAERRKVLEGLAKGKVDVVIGTHALLNEEIKFKDLGLLVIDEEQKFGVKHKESLKKLRVNVDVLSMSATPIPRTLSMAMMHIRQMSVINDPPPGRLPIRTFVRPYADEVVREAVLREMARGGQVFYVFNRVTGIQHVAERLRKLVPTARIAVGHGQMGEQAIEPVMMGFLNGEIDILVSTTIVENGLDISNANTLIVENSDMFGLSQLYQLRGRVGRSDRQAYAYLLYQGAKALTENASSRLSALQEFSQLGSGYSLAFRDLQIRGAGDLLGAKQSGQMSAVGFDLYAQLVDSEVKYLKAAADGSPLHVLDDPLEGLEPLPSVDLPVVALIPAAYIEEEGQRLYYYKQLMTCRDSRELFETEKEIEDRYGHLPAPVRTAVAVMECRLRCRSAGVRSVVAKEGRLAIEFQAEHLPSPRAFSILASRNRQAILSNERYSWPYSGDALAACRGFLEAIEVALGEVSEQRAALGQSSS